MNDQQVAAQVVLSRSRLSDADSVSRQFAAAGFTVGPLVGTSLSVAGSVGQFENFFGVKAERAGPRPFGTDELPLTALPAQLRRDVQAILFTRPPDFGPTSFS